MGILSRETAGGSGVNSAPVKSCEFSGHPKTSEIEKIDVKIFRENRQAVLEVTNFSEELSREQLDKMFERFYRSENARSCNSKCDGHGLGLAIAQKIVENLEGSLSVRNEKFIIDGEEKFKTTFRVGLNFGK